MEYCDGGTLEQFRAQTMLSEDIISLICKNILLGLQYLHEEKEKYIVILNQKIYFYI